MDQADTQLLQSALVSRRVDRANQPGEKWASEKYAMAAAGPGRSVGASRTGQTRRQRANASALAAAHEAGLIHRDFSPANLMVSENGQAKVMDFGLVRLDVDSHDDRPLDSRENTSLELTQAGTVMGTAGYMSPEQHLAALTDTRTDQFSFCVTLWETVVGERPFAGETTAELKGNVTQGKLRPPPSGARVPGWLRKACERAEPSPHIAPSTSRKHT